MLFSMNAILLVTDHVRYIGMLFSMNVIKLVTDHVRYI